MKYIVLLILNIVIFIGAYFLFNYLQRKSNNDLKYKKNFFIITLLYVILIPIINYTVVRLLTNNLYKLHYDINKIEEKISDINKSIVTITNNIEKYNNELENIQHEKNVRELETYQAKEQETKESLNELNNSLNDIKDEYLSWSSKYNDLEQKSVFRITNFPTVNQFPNYPNGCEIAALYLLLKYYNVNVTLEQLANNLDKGPAPFKIDGIYFGSDPEYKFVGDPRKTNKQGYGVYQKPIAKLANMYKGGIIDYTGHDLDSVLKIVKSGRPVQVWASINLKETTICQSWIDVDSGKKIDWRCNLHSMVIVGYTYNDVIVSDPYTGTIRSFSKTLFEKIYNNYGKRALYYE